MIIHEEPSPNSVSSPVSTAKDSRCYTVEDLMDKLNGGDIKAVQGDSGHAQASMVTEQYAHILDDDRRLNAQRFDDFFYQHHGAEPEVLPRAEQSTPKASPVDTDAAAALAKLLADPSMATLIKNLAKNL